MRLIPNELYLYKYFMIFKESSDNTMQRCKRLHTWKDVKHCFDFLQSRWKLMQNPSHQWDMNTIKDILIAYVIMHNMIMNNERDQEMKPTIVQPKHVSWRHEPIRRGLNLKIMYVDMKWFGIKGHTTCLRMTSWKICGN